MHLSPFIVPIITLVVILVFAGCEPRQPSANIIEAVGRKHYDVQEVQTILEDNPAAIDETNDYGERPLQIASGFGRTRAVALLLDHGADVNAIDDLGQTALHFACDAGELETARLLLEANAQVIIADHDGNTPLHTVVEYDWDSIELVRLLIASGADVNAKNNDGESPLDIAIRLKEFYNRPSNDRERSFDEEMIKQLEAVEEVLKTAMTGNGS